MKKLLCWLTLVCLALVPTLSALAEAEPAPETEPAVEAESAADAQAHTIEEKTIDLYVGSPDPSIPLESMPITVYFIDGSDVPYLNLADWPAILNGPDTEGTEGTDAPADETADDNGEAADDTDAPAADDAAPADDDAAADDDTPEGADVTDQFTEEEIQALNEILANAARDAEDQDPSEAPDLTFSMEGNVGTLTRYDGYFVTFDCDADTIHFLDYDAYMRPNNGTFLIDMLSLNSFAEDGSFRYFARDKGSYQRFGKEVEINAGDYGIDFIANDGACLVPMQTVGDVLMSRYGALFFYNGENVFIGGKNALGTSDQLTPMGEMFYSVEPHERSESMALFTYSELCLALDALYGLKPNHSIDSFDALADDTGLKEDLTGTDPVAADVALYKLLIHHLDDLHTAYLLPSPQSGVHAGDSFLDDLGDGQSNMRYMTQANAYGGARKTARPDGIPAYEEIDNTAYITFDGFDTVPQGVDYYQDPPTEAPKDTIGLFIYAYQQIMREDSPIENVVIDVSCNLGGDAEAALYVIASCLGSCSLSTRNTLSGALVTANYGCDLNLDGQIDDDDMGLMTKRLFCLESPISFSCGNLVPCAFKQSNMVTLLGRTSGGGACVVQPLTTADGSLFQISGPLQLSFLKNGAFYDIDQGAEPDFPLMNPASFYDREALTEYINQIR